MLACRISLSKALLLTASGKEQWNESHPIALEVQVQVALQRADLVLVLALCCGCRQACLLRLLAGLCGVHVTAHELCILAHAELACCTSVSVVFGKHSHQEEACIHGTSWDARSK